jgi:DNA-binding CsgD family transcriptional regulator
VLGTHPGISIISRTSSIGKILSVADEAAPDVVIIDAVSLSKAVRAVEHVAPPARFDWDEIGLTPRELQVLTLVAEGRTSREIALILRVAPRTVETHREHIRRKLGTSSIAGFTRFAIARGLLGED